MKDFTVQEPEYTAQLENGKTTFYYRGDVESTANITDEIRIQQILEYWADDGDIDLMINIIEALQEQYTDLTICDYKLKSAEEVYNFMLSEDAVDQQINRIEANVDDYELNEFRDIQRDFIYKASAKLGFE